MNRKSKSLLAMLLVFAMMFSFAACTGGGNTDDPVSQATDEPAGEPTENAATAEPTAEPTEAPTPEPTEEPTEEPTQAPISDKYDVPYVTRGLYALYEGYFNSEDGQNKEATVWADLSGHGYDITDLEPGEKLVWKDDGLYVSAQKIIFPEEIKELINSDEYTIEFSLKDFELTGNDYATFLNSDGNDNFSLFLRRSDDTLEFKCNNAIGTRPNLAGASEELADATIAVTFSADDIIELYLNGEYIADRAAPGNTNIAGNFFLGHPDATRSYNATIVSVRFYDRVLSAKELAANAAVDGNVAAK